MRGRKRGRPAHADVHRYTDAEEAFILAVARWRERNRGRQPDLTELLAILKGLGWQEPQPPQ